MINFFYHHSKFVVRTSQSFDKLEAENPKKEKIYLICDNAGYHKSKKVKEYLVNSKIELVLMPKTKNKIWPNYIFSFTI